MNKLIPLTLTALGLATPASAQITAFQHIILVIQENRTPDNFFQGLCSSPSACSTNPGPQQYNIQTKGWLDKTSRTGTTDPKAVPFGLGYDLGHSHQAFLAMCDLKGGSCATDGAAKVKCTVRSQPCPARAAFGYVDNSTGALQPYLDLVKFYGWANYMFQTNQGNSYPAHQFLFAATSAPSKRDDHAGNFVSDSGTGGIGCDASPRAAAPVIDANGVIYGNVPPCFEHKALSDLLEARSISWRYYGVAGDIISTDGPKGGIWIAPNSIAHICNASDHKCQGTEWTSHLQFTPNQVLKDISHPTCNLAGVSWVIPDSLDSDHMGRPTATNGPSWVANIVNGVGNSTCTDKDGTPYWKSTAILVTWDDWGGWYDHEPPLIEASPWGGYQMGFRVPLIVVSAYTPKGYIHNGKEDFGSVIRFVEHNFGIPEGALTFADAREGVNDLRQFFSLGNAPRPFQTINAPLSAQYFLTRKPSGLPVDDE